MLLLEHERRDFAMRENTLAHGGRDPGRSLPAVSTAGDGVLADMPPFEAYR